MMIEACVGPLFFFRSSHIAHLLSLFYRSYQRQQSSMA
jgi:hypothetical protein